MTENQKLTNPIIPCPACQRPNGLTRTLCIYCGVALPLTDTALQRPVLRALEEWERGYNVVSRLRPGDNPDCPAAAAWLNLDVDYLSGVAGAGVTLPLVRVATETDAALIVKRLQEFGWPAVTVSDHELSVPETPAKRVSRLTWDDAGLLTAYPIGGSAPFSVAWEEMKLFVTGRLTTRQVETTERPQGRQGAKEILDARELSHDEVVLDGYGPDLAHSWRIYLNSFDFSCLGERKTLLARENFVTLCQELRQRAGAAVWQGNYDQVRGLLVAAWPFSERTDARGWQRGGPGRLSLQTAVTSSNEIQFTRFSRLCYYLAARRDEN